MQPLIEAASTLSATFFSKEALKLKGKQFIFETLPIFITFTAGNIASPIGNLARSVRLIVNSPFKFCALLYANPSTALKKSKDAIKTEFNSYEHPRSIVEKDDAATTLSSSIQCRNNLLFGVGLHVEKKEFGISINKPVESTMKLTYFIRTVSVLFSLSYIYILIASIIKFTPFAILNILITTIITLLITRPYYKITKDSRFLVYVKQLYVSLCQSIGVVLLIKLASYLIASGFLALNYPTLIIATSVVIFLYLIAFIEICCSKYLNPTQI